MDITYKKVGDYYYPELEIPKKYKDFTRRLLYTQYSSSRKY